MPGQLNNFQNQRLGQATSAKKRMNQDTDAPNVAFPATELLMQSGGGQNLSVAHGEEGKVAAQVDVLAPIMDYFDLCDAVFDEHALLHGHGEEEFVEGQFVGAG